ncbi:MAG: hypothetical protein LBK97_03255 [Prevotellaceae bacterium]|jgi:hypothetical protein|nr:hypothetical protein [Prevotellaceae bacterium]
MKKFFLLLILVAGSVFISNGCSSDDDNEEIEDLAKKAAVEFCNCFKTKSKDACLKELKSNYDESDYLNNRFVEAFNKAQSCDVLLEIITLPGGN